MDDDERGVRNHDDVYHLVMILIIIIITDNYSCLIYQFQDFIQLSCQVTDHKDYVEHFLMVFFFFFLFLFFFF